MILRGISGAHICLRCQLRLLNKPVQAVVLPPNTKHPRGARLQHNQSQPGVFDEGTKAFTPEETLEKNLEKGIPEGRTTSEAQLQHSESHRDRSNDATETPTSEEEIPEELTPPEAESQPWRVNHPRFRRLHAITDTRLLPSVSKHPLGRLHGFRGHKLREKAIGLDIDSLGSKSEVIVLRDSGARYNPRPEIEELKGAKPIDILAQLNAERGLIGQSEVEKNIDELMPEGSSRVISWDALRSIEQQLANGFTINQLLQYIHSFDAKQKSVEKQPQVEPSGPITRITSWMPGESESGEEFVETLSRGYGSEAFTPKQLLALQIIRQCWRLEAAEVVESLGEIELEVRGAEFELLTKGRLPPLRIISEKLIINQEEKIEAFRSRSVIRITAVKEKATFILQEIQQVLKGSRRLDVDLKRILPQRRDTSKSGKQVDATLGQAAIAEIARLTDTEIRVLPDDQLSIYCIARKPQSNLSTGADVARRLLLTSFANAHDRTVTHVGCKDVSGPLAAVKYRATDGMPWRDQLREWVRWTSAVTKSSSTAGEPVDTGQFVPESADPDKKINDGNPLLSNDSALSGDFGLSQEAMNQGNVLNNARNIRPYVYWDTKTFTTTSATVGHILREASEAAEIATVSPKDAMQIQDTIFRPGGISLSRFLGTMEDVNKTSKPSLVMRFLPSPWTAAGSEASERCPPIEMRFIIGVNKNVELKDVLAVVASSASDMMLPDRSLDLRFQQRTTARLRTLHHHQLPEITEFLKASQLNIARGRLETPPSLTLPIATHLFTGADSASSDNSMTDLIDVEYLFAGLEYRSTLGVNFENWTLLYTSIEGGKADGRRRELSLRPRRLNGKTSQGNHEETNTQWQVKQTRDFMESAFRLVDALENPGGLGFPVQRIKSSQSIQNKKKEASKKKALRKQNKRGPFKYFTKTIDFTEESPEADLEDNQEQGQQLLNTAEHERQKDDRSHREEVTESR